MSQRVPFREQALKHYSQQDRPAVRLRLVSLRAAYLLWLALLLCVGMAFASWLVQIPSYASVSGVVQASPADIVLFLPASQASLVHAGTSIQVQIGASGPQFATTVTDVNTTVLSPSTARQRYNLGSAAWGVATEPSVVLTAHLGAGLSASAYAGSVVVAQVQVGTSPVFRLLPGLSIRTGGTYGA
jgi:hypothetical protein